MRRTRLRWMYLPRIPKKAEKDHPMQVQNAESFLRSAAVLATFTCIMAVVMALRKVQTRERQSEQEVTRKRAGQQVVIIGAGAGGSATAALIANASPDVRITVIEKDRQQTFLGQVPLAHAGHRSYDLGTTTGADVLRSPATWNVTREANLVASEVLRVDPDGKRVYVRSSPGMLACAKPLSEEEEKARAAAAGAGMRGRLARWWRGSAAQPAAISTNEDGSLNLEDGTTMFTYDALVVAAGAQRTVGHLRPQLPPQLLDSYRIAVNPGTTRDSLASMYTGNVLYIKVPPASFVWQMEAARALLRGKGKAARKACATVDFVEPKSAASRSENSTLSTPVATSTDTTVVTAAWTAVRKRWDAFKASPASAADVVLPDEVALRLSAAASATPVAPPSWPLPFLSQWCMHFSSRQHDSTFVSSTNTIWKYLSYFNKLSLCHLFAVTADLHPIGPAPSQVNDVIKRFWRERQLDCRYGDSFLGDRFHVLHHSYVTSIDSQANVVTLYDYRNDAEVRIPFNLLVLDLPLRAPGFVQQSGLHRTRYVEECVLPALAAGTQPAPKSLAEASSVPVAASTSSAVEKVLRRPPLLGKTKAELEAIFADESSFMDVDPTTLQHRRYADIFAVGDVAGLPSVKSYGAVFAQVPVVAHNVRQVLMAQLANASARAETTETKSPTLQSTTQPSPSPLPRVNARYNGYSSFHVVMTTWRAMWPEMQYPVDPYNPTKPADALPADVEEALKKEQWDVVSPRAYCDHHIWNNLAWRDLRGFFNAFYYQWSLYELMYFFVFSRGLWHSPTWFVVPSYSVEDGTPSLPSLMDML